MARLSDRARASQAIWPGFVDAMTALLLVLMFVLSIFMIVQFVLRETITGQENQLDELGSQLAQLSNVLAMEQDRADTAEASLADTTAEANRLASVVASLSSQRDDLTARVASFEEQVASLMADRDGLRAALTASDEQVALLEDQNRQEITAKEAAQIALAQAREEIDAQTETARLAAARREALEALIADLEADKAAGETAISTLEASKAANLALIAALEGERGTLAQANQALEDETAELTAERVERLRRLAELETELSAEERQKLVEAAAAKVLRDRLANADAELTAMTLALEKQRAEAEATLTLLAAAEAARDGLDADLSEEAQALSREQALLATARRALAERQAKVSEQAKTLALLNQQAAALRQQLSALSAQLEASEALDTAQDVQLANLGQRLNAALARELALKAKEAARLEAERSDLETYRSEFFGEMRKALGDRQDIRIVGDRFVFQSEVLFAPGSADIGFAGRGELASLGDAIREVVARIPAEIDWILVVEGHTDNLPLSGTGRFRDNWELSQARALSVVRYLSDEQELPAERLAALGYGEYQPLDGGDSVEARARNRRIEVKFTERPPRSVIEGE